MLGLDLPTTLEENAALPALELQLDVTVHERSERDLANQRYAAAAPLVVGVVDEDLAIMIVGPNSDMYPRIFEG